MWITLSFTNLLPLVLFSFLFNIARPRDKVTGQTSWKLVLSLHSKTLLSFLLKDLNLPRGAKMDVIGWLGRTFFRLIGKATLPNQMELA